MEPEGLCADERVFASIHDQRRLVCVEVPGEHAWCLFNFKLLKQEDSSILSTGCSTLYLHTGIVENVDRAVSCLGGISAVSKVTNSRIQPAYLCTLCCFFPRLTLREEVVWR